MGIAPSWLNVTLSELYDLTHVPVWTDDYSDLFRLMIRGQPEG